MRPVVLAPILALALTVAACNKAAAPAPPPNPTPEQEAASQASDFSKPMVAQGNEPFWALKIDGTQFTLTRPDHPDMAFVAPGAKIVPGKAEWQARSAKGEVLAVTLYVSPCSDGMSDIAYPMTAEVVFAGQTLRGCAAKAADLPSAPAKA